MSDLTAVTESELIQIVKNWTDGASFLYEPLTHGEMAQRLQEAIECRPPESPISSDQVMEIVRTYGIYAAHGPMQDDAPSSVTVAAATTAVTTNDQQPDQQQIARVKRSVADLTPEEWAARIKAIAATDYPLPPELKHLKSLTYQPDRGYWLVNRCEVCGNYDKEECCGQKTKQVVASGPNRTQPQYQPKKSDLWRTGEEAAGLVPIRTPKTKEEKAEEQAAAQAQLPFWNSFSSADELASGGVKMYIDNFLPEGITLICGLPKEGKTFLAMSLVKALTTANCLFGNPKFSVPEKVPCLYLAAEVSDRALQQRLRKFNITNDKSLFLCRTLSKGPKLGLYHGDVEAVVRSLKPVVFLDTIIRFNDSDDEDNATANQKLVDAMFHLRSLGARAIVGQHHSRKDFKDGEPTLERAVRGSGDLAAMCDVIWALTRDERLYKNNAGPNEINVVGWGRDFNPVPMRLALTKKAPKDIPGTVITFAPGIVSCIDEGDLAYVDKSAAPVNALTVEQLLQSDPAVTLQRLSEATGKSLRDVKRALTAGGWIKAKGQKALWSQKAA